MLQVPAGDLVPGLEIMVDALIRDYDLRGKSQAGILPAAGMSFGAYWDETSMGAKKMSRF